MGRLVGISSSYVSDVSLVAGGIPEAAASSTLDSGVVGVAVDDKQIVCVADVVVVVVVAKVRLGTKAGVEKAWNRATWAASTVRNKVPNAVMVVVVVCGCCRRRLG